MTSLLILLTSLMVLLSSSFSAKVSKGRVKQTDRSIKACERLKEMFMEQDCLQKESLRCKLIAFKLRGGILTDEPRCEFLPCVGYKQPANQTCESTCFGTVVSTGLCEAGKTCCVQSGKPKFCPYKCQSSYSCKTPINGFICPYAGDVCCEGTDHFPSFPTKKQCPYTCVSSFGCKDVDYTSTCGFGLDVCCRTPGNPFPFDVASDFGHAQFGQHQPIAPYGSYASLGFFDGYGIENKYPSQTGYGYKEPLYQCPYTCRSSVGCSEIYTTTGCGSHGDVCCKTVYKNVPLTTAKPPVKALTVRIPKTTTATTTTSTTITTTTTSTTTTPKPCLHNCRNFFRCAAIDYTSFCDGALNFCCLRELEIDGGAQTTPAPLECPFECRSSLLCAEEDSSFPCSGRKVCCKRRKKDKTVEPLEVSPAS